MKGLPGLIGDQPEQMLNWLALVGALFQDRRFSRDDIFNVHRLLAEISRIGLRVGDKDGTDLLVAAPFDLAIHFDPLNGNGEHEFVGHNGVLVKIQFRAT
jgi:hypothetical protein